MRFVSAITLALTVCLVSLTTPASAQRLDLSTLTCKDFIASKKENIGLILMWLHGYMNDDDSPPIIDFDKFGKDSEKLAAYCAVNPTDGVMTAAEQVLD